MAEYFKNNSKIIFKLFTNACEEQPNQNILISPLALQICFASIYLSSSADEKNGIEILKLLELSPKTTIDEIKEIFSQISQIPESDFFNMNIFNKFYIQYDKLLNNDFIDNSLKIIKTEVNNIDYNKIQHVIEKINDDCSKSTEQKICQILTHDDIQNLSLSPSTSSPLSSSLTANNINMIIANAASLNASWDVSFYEIFDKKGKGDFQLENGEKIEVDMMENTIPHFRYGEFDDLNFKVAELRYAGHYENELSMLILLPNENILIQGIQNKLEEIDFFDLCNNMQEKPMWIKFPKFKTEYKLDLIKAFNKLNEINLFKDKFKFSNLFLNEPDMKIDKLIHKAEIESNEIGTDDRELPRHLAVCSELPNIIEFFVNRPFIYVVKDKNSIYFLGKVMNPS